MYNWKATSIEELAQEYQEVIEGLTDSYQARMMEIQTGILQQAAGAESIPLPEPPQTQPPKPANISDIRSKLNYEESPKTVQKKKEFKGYPNDFWAGDFCSLDRETTIYDGDRDKAISLIEDVKFQSAVEEIKANAESYNLKKDLLKTSFRLSRLVAPNVYQIADLCRDKLGLKIELEFYVSQDQYYNAYVYPPNDNKLCIILTSALLEAFDTSELTFVIGHEIGHYLFNHFRWDTQQIFCSGSPDITPRHSVTIYQWKRDAEITADRVGLICCGDFQAAANAFFKLSTGIRNQDTLDFQLQSYLDQFIDLKNELENDGTDIQDLYTSHPFGPLRVKALELFAKSETYYKLAKLNGGEITEQQMEDEISELMDLMVPKYLNDDSEQSKMIQKLLFWAGIDVAEADGNVDESEIKALQSIISDEIYKQEYERYQKLDRNRFSPAYYGSQYGHEVLTFADKITTHNIVRDICLIALSDGLLDESEMYVIQNIACFLQVDPEFINSILEGAESDFN